MENTLNPVNIVGCHLFIPKHYTQPLWSDKSDKIIILVHKSWLSSLLSSSTVPNFTLHDSLSNEEVEAALVLGSKFSPSWQKLLVRVLPKPIPGQKALSLPRPRSSQPTEDTGLSYPQLLHYVSTTNYKNLWKRNYKKYLGDKKRKGKEAKKDLAVRESLSVLKDTLFRFYGCPILMTGSKERVTGSTGELLPHPNILPAACVVETPSELLVLYPLSSHVTLKEFVTFSPTVFQTDLNKPMFIAYQLLQALRDSHDRALVLGDIRLDDVFISPDLFIQIVPQIGSNVFPVTHEDLVASGIPRPPVDGSLATLSLRWIQGDLTNYDYLMYLNAAAGRRFGNPSCHFVVPWVSDLSTRGSGAWRDLTKSKFRLNKGDRQLDLTYENASSTQAPHHVTDVLSEITYYVYLARRTPQAVLCRYVRPTWVPAEYPGSIQRLYAWTPDECIPEFYTDPSIFKSIHEDLCDLELPPWAPTPEEFISAHREQLESRRVTEKLHHWIDVTFGYKLTGPPAVKAKNVCLHLASGHTSLATSGVVQVFTNPHPRRQGPLPGFDKQPPKHRKVQAERDDDGLHSSEGDDEADSKGSPLLLHRFLSVSRSSLLAPFQTSSEDVVPLKSSAASSLSVGGPRSKSSGALDNPLALLNAVEAAYTFHRRTFGTSPPEPSVGAAGSKIKQAVAAKRLQEMQVLGCLITEIFLNCHIRIQTTNSVDERIAACLRQVTNESLPHCVRPALRLLLDSYPPITDVGLPPPSAHQILQPLLSSFILPFPSSMPQLFAAVSRLKTLQRFEDTSELRVKLFSDDLGRFLNGKNIDLVYLFVRDLLEDSATASVTVSSILDKVLSYLGAERTNELFLDSILSLYERSPPLVYLYQRKFLLTLMVRCGLKVFLNYIVVLIVEAAGCVVAHPQLEGAADEEVSSPEVEERFPVEESCPEVGVFSFDREDTPSDGESLQNLMEQLTGTSDDDEGELTAEDTRHVLRSPPIPVASQPGWTEKVTSIECDVGSKGSDVIHRGSDVTTRPPPVYDELAPMAPQQQSLQIHEIAADSILWLSRRLGPVLTAKHVTRNLLKMLTLCYTGPGALSSALIKPEEDLTHWKLSVARHKVVGDENAEQILFCLKQLVELYGEQLILVQYLPFMSEVIAITKRKLSYSTEGGVVGSLALLKHVLSLLSDATLMDSLQDIILRDIVHPLVRLMVSTRNSFPSGHVGRLALATKLLDTLYFLAVHIGAEMTRVHLAVPSLQRFFLAFDKAVGLRLETEDSDRSSPSRESTTLDELRRVFSPSLAHCAYLAFFRLLGESSMQNAVVNHELVRRLCLLHERQADSSSRQKGSVSGTYLTDLFTSGESRDIHHKGGAASFGASVTVVGNKIELQDDVAEDSGATTSTTQFKDTTRHVRGNWLAYWEHEIGRSEKDTRFNFKQIKLQTFTGHSHAVRCLEVLDNENSLVSGSRDKTVKLWCLRSQGDGSSTVPCQFSYTGHRKSLVGVAYLPGPRLVASCDVTVHLWDPLVGRNVSIVESKATCSALKAWDSTLLAGTSDSSLRVIDARTASSTAELKISWSPGGLVRCICISRDGTWAAVGQSSGQITILGLRTALVMATWKAHEGEVLQLAPVDNNTLISSSIDQTVSVWNIQDGKLKFYLKGPTEPVHCLKTHGQELITGTTANRIGVHTAIDAHAGFSSTKLRSDTFKGVLTAMALLPLNMQLLLGTDYGHITLLC